MARPLDGSAVTTLNDQLNAVLPLAGLTHNSRAEKYTLCSLRHFYAVMALTKGIDIYTVARKMGTSVEII